MPTNSVPAGDSENQEIVIRSLRNSFIVAIIDPKKVRTSENIENAQFFIPPSTITRYLCGHCDREHEGAPKIKVTVTSLLRRDPEHIIAQGLYLCRRCDGLVYSNSIKDFSTIDSTFVERDDTGQIIKPTPESIDRRLKDVEKQASEGSSWNGRFHRNDLEIALDLSKIIDYAVPIGRVKSIFRTHRQAFLSRISRELPELVDELLDSSRMFNSYADDITGESSFGSSGVSEKFFLIYKHLRHLEIPNDPVLKRKIHEVLTLYRGMFVSSIVDLERQKIETDTKIREERAAITGIDARITEYAKKVGLEPYGMSATQPL